MASGAGEAGEAKPTLEMKGVPINADQNLEREADLMGRRAAADEAHSVAGGSCFGDDGTRGSGRGGGAAHR
jgi:hypothetical protein